MEKKFDSVFRRVNKTSIVLAILYATVLLVMIFALIKGGVNESPDYQKIGFLLFSIFMLLRHLLFIFEKTYVDCQKGEVRLKLQRKVFLIKDIVSIEKQPRRSMVKGQMRITNSKGDAYPIYVDDEDKFIELLLSVNSEISVS